MSTEQEHPSKLSIDNKHQSSPWRLIQNGFNIEGLCTNSRCQAHNQMVIMNLGFGEFDHSRIILQRSNTCPMCDKSISPMKYAFSKCQWWYVNHYSTYTYPLNTVNDTYELKDLHCEYIVMEIMPLPENYQLSRRPQELICPICLMNIENNKELIHLRCLHFFHRNCIAEWLRSKEFMSKTCPLCRDYIVKRNQTNNSIISSGDKTEKC